MRVRKVGDPVAHGLVDGIFEGVGAGVYWNDLNLKSALDHEQGVQGQIENNLGSKHLYPENVERLAADVLGTHVDDTFHVEARADRRSCDTMLARTSFRDDACLA